MIINEKYNEILKLLINININNNILDEQLINSYLRI